jgi:hypothetical protein
MKKLLSAAVFTVIIAAYAQGAGVPVQNMTPYSLGVEYHGAINGHPMLYSFDSSAIVSHFARLHYSPSKFFRFSGGIGGASPHNNAHYFLGSGYSYKIDSKMGLSATGGAALFLPKLLPVLSITAGYDGSYLKYVEEETRIPTSIYGDDHLTTPDTAFVFGKTMGKMHTPYVGFIFHPNRYVDFEVGGMYKIFDMRKSRHYNYWGWEYELDNDGKKTDSVWTYHYTATKNSDDEKALKEIKEIKEMRVYGSITVNEPTSGAYLSAGLSVAPKVKDEFKTNNWLTRSSMWLSVGVLLKDPSHNKKKSTGRYSGSYNEMKIRQNEMAQDLLLEVDHEDDED